MKTYSHIRRKALDEAAAALEPTVHTAIPLPETIVADSPLIG